MANNKEILKELDILMPHGRIPKELLEVVWDIYNNDKDFNTAAKLAIAAFEYSLCGDTNFEDDRPIMRLLKPYKEKFEGNLSHYTAACEDQRYEKQFDTIAKLYFTEHKTQKEIGAQLKISQPEVSRRISFIRENYPELVDRYKID